MFSRLLRTSGPALLLLSVTVASPVSAVSISGVFFETNPPPSIGSAALHDITHSNEWQAMKQSLQQAGYQGQGMDGWKNGFLCETSGGSGTIVIDAMHNDGLHANAMLQYFQGVDDLGVPVTFWGYTINKNVNGVYVSDTYAWDTPADFGDASRLKNVWNNYVNCVIGGLGQSLFAAYTSGFYNGDAGSTFAWGAAGTYGSCIGNAINSINWHD